MLAYGINTEKVKRENRIKKMGLLKQYLPMESGAERDMAAISASNRLFWRTPDPDTRKRIRRRR